MITGLEIMATLAVLGFQRPASPDQPETSDFYKWDSLFKKYGSQYQVPWKWLKAIAWIESDLGRDSRVRRGLANASDAASVSSDGLSFGLMQVTLPTANWLRPGTSIEDLNNPEISVQIAALYLKAMLTRYFPNSRPDFSQRELVIRSYNGGPGWLHSGQAAKDATAAYYARFMSKLQTILQLQGDNERE